MSISPTTESDISCLGVFILLILLKLNYNPSLSFFEKKLTQNIFIFLLDVWQSKFKRKFHNIIPTNLIRASFRIKNVVIQLASSIGEKLIIFKCRCIVIINDICVGKLLNLSSSSSFNFFFFFEKIFKANQIYICVLVWYEMASYFLFLFTISL